MLMRYTSSIAIGAAVTFGLLFLMQQMIATGRAVWTQEVDDFRIDFVRVEQPPTVVTKREKPDKLPEPAPKPQPETPDGLDDFKGDIGVTIGPPKMGQEGGLRVPGPGLSDGEYLPIVTVAPIYPARAVARELEGHVVVQFTVTRTGATRDIRVLESSSSLFEPAAVTSAAKYRYKPRVINGEPVEVPGVQTLVRFVLQD
jgi:protein TonB